MYNPIISIIPTVGFGTKPKLVEHAVRRKTMKFRCSLASGLQGSVDSSVSSSISSSNEASAHWASIALRSIAWLGIGSSWCCIALLDRLDHSLDLLHDRTRHLGGDHLSRHLRNHHCGFLRNHPWHLSGHHLSGLLWHVDHDPLLLHPRDLLSHSLHVLLRHHCCELLINGVVGHPGDLPLNSLPLLPHDRARHLGFDNIGDGPHGCLLLCGHGHPGLHFCLCLHNLNHGRLCLWDHGCLRNHHCGFLRNHPGYLDLHCLHGLLWHLDQRGLGNLPLHLLLLHLHDSLGYLIDNFFIDDVHCLDWNLPLHCLDLWPHCGTRHLCLDCLHDLNLSNLFLLGHNCPRLRLHLRLHLLYHRRLRLWYHGGPWHCLHLSFHDSLCHLLRLHNRLLYHLLHWLLVLHLLNWLSIGLHWLSIGLHWLSIGLHRGSV